MNRKNNLSDSVKPRYEFTWGDRSRRTDELEYSHKLGSAGVQMLAEFGKEDPECEVALLGYET